MESQSRRGQGDFVHRIIVTARPGMRHDASRHHNRRRQRRRRLAVDSRPAALSLFYRPQQFIPSLSSVARVHTAQTPRWLTRTGGDSEEYCQQCYSANRAPGQFRHFPMSSHLQTSSELHTLADLWIEEAPVRVQSIASTSVATTAGNTNHDAL